MVNLRGLIGDALAGCIQSFFSFLRVALEKKAVVIFDKCRQAGYLTSERGISMPSPAKV
jgi:hypothetical protein